MHICHTVDIITGLFNLATSSTNGKFVINPDEIFINGKFNFFTISKLGKSPGVVNIIIFFSNNISLFYIVLQ